MNSTNFNNVDPNSLAHALTASMESVWDQLLINHKGNYDMESTTNYKILSLVRNEYKVPSIGIGSGETITDRGNIRAYRDGYAQEYWDIKSLIRLPDGEIFNIGDKITWDWVDAGSNDYFTIERFYLDGDELRMDTEESYNNGFLIDDDFFKSLSHYNPKKKSSKKNYKILSFVTTGAGKQVFRRRSGRRFQWRSVKRTLEYLKNSSEYVIHSIKRLSDDKVFTIGDRISGKHYKNRVIIGFEPEQGGEYWIHQASNEKSLDGGYSKLEHIDHVEKPVLTTTDGVEIFDENRTLYVPHYEYKCINNPKAQSVAREWNIRKYPAFAYKGNAEEYIEEHKPRYSRADFREAIAEKSEEVFGDIELKDIDTGELYPDKFIEEILTKMDSYE